MCLGKLGKSCHKIIPWPIRIVFGILFITFGYMKLGNLAGVSDMFTSAGIPLAMIAASVVALVEFIGGIFVLVGLFTRWVAVLWTIIMIVAIITVTAGQGFIAGWSVNLWIIAGCLTLLFTGAGKWSLERTIFKKEL